MYACIVLHFIGEYLFRNEYLKEHQKENLCVALIYNFIYIIPFLIFSDITLLQALVIFSGHLVIDKYNLTLKFMCLSSKFSNLTKNFCFDASRDIHVLSAQDLMKSNQRYELIDITLKLTLIFLTIKYIH